MSELEQIIERPGTERVGDNQWQAPCPAHDDNEPSLSISKGRGGKLLLHCFAGCTFEAIHAALNCEGPVAKGASKIVATFEYHDTKGKHLYTKRRWEPGFNSGRKSFDFITANGQKGRGCDAVPYNLPAVVSADTVFVVEGEAKAGLLNSWGLVGTCLDSGANSPWRPEYALMLAGKHLVILPDNDEPGRQYAEKIARAMHGKALNIKVVTLPGLPEKGDIIDWAGARS